MLPVLFIFDLDNTLIGTSESIEFYRKVITFIKDASKSGKLNVKDTFPTWNKFINDSFYRKGLKEAFTQIKQMYPTAEFFIYSSGTKSYVNEYVRNVEKFIDVKINTPYFSRSECPIDETNNFKKSIISQYPTILKTLSNKYPTIEKHQEEVLKNRTIFIDDSDYLWDKKEKWIKCKPYNYYPIFDIDSKLLELIHTTPMIRDYIKAAKLDKLFLIDESKNYDEYRMNYHLFMANLHRSYLSTNREAQEDTFFEKFVKALRGYKDNVKPFTDNHIKLIQKQL